ncbi:MAG: RNA polymerase sigma factor [Oscillospiraceae bacterium]|nr:RNA polymerase sigma factor [Oscillospiraceae bacterium]
MTEFEAVYRRYFRDVYRYCLALTRDEQTAEEVTQETFFKALGAIDKFDGKCKIYVWLCQIAKHTYFTMRSKGKRQEILPEEPGNGENLEEKLLTKESAFEIHRILHRLEEPYKEVFSLRTFGELPFRQIGELFGKTESWARVTYHRARLKIKEELR